MTKQSHPSWQRRHETVLQFYLRYPWASRNDCARATGYSPTHVSRITCSEEFKQRYMRISEKVAQEAALARLLQPREVVSYHVKDSRHY